MQEFTISLSWGIWILVTIWMQLKPSCLSLTVWWLVLVAAAFVSVYLVG